jgi:hypothetical protein
MQESFGKFLCRVATQTQGLIDSVDYSQRRTTASLARARSNGDQRNFISLLILGYALGLWIKHRFPVDQELILMMTRGKRYLDEPAAVGLSLHWGGYRLPFVKVSDQVNRLGFLGSAEKVHRFDGFLWRETIG